MKKGFRILKFKKDKPIFEVKDLTKSYDGRPILKKVSLKIFPGECVGVSWTQRLWKNYTFFNLYWGTDY